MIGVGEFMACSNRSLLPTLFCIIVLISLSRSKNAAGGKKEDLSQPECRFDYNWKMGGVDIADQLNQYYQTLHRARAYFWRRVFEQKLMQATSNAWLLFCWWLKDSLKTVDGEISALKAAGHAEGGEGVEGLLLASLLEEQRNLKALQSKNRAQWMRALSMHLMSLCDKGCASKGGRRERAAPASAPTYLRMKRTRREHFKGIEGRKYCESPNCKGCAESKEGAKRPRRARVATACFCTSCAKVGGVVMCLACHEDDERHSEAYANAAAPLKSGLPKKRKNLL